MFCIRVFVNVYKEGKKEKEEVKGKEEERSGVTEASWEGTKEEGGGRHTNQTINFVESVQKLDLEFGTGTFSTFRKFCR
jgi:hypothetical protein